MYYPVFIELKGRDVLVVGGGPVAERKVDGLLAAGAHITLVSPEVTERLSAASISWRRQTFQEADLDGMMLVICATGNSEVQRQVVDAARKRSILVNTVDQPELCDFIVPAVVRRGDVIGAISTSGSSPALAAFLRARLEELISDDVGRAAGLLGSIRKEVQARIPDSGRRKEVFERVIESGLLDWIGECDDETALKRIRKTIETL